MENINQIPKNQSENGSNLGASRKDMPIVNNESGKNSENVNLRQIKIGTEDGNRKL